ncbi:MAG: 1-(5-phosphoribosyl)-5-[(5-phosphoribosylamino)methylideneamino]imidazole-4-carboxamide isomerase [Opitutales bacterium]|nr:1-(5-phosphoribosyl)-5-[(5-phosphoribosylamino)methylideneamino]imidazole-4-carboxamide isomerase [Opitutales bacterium]
MKIYPAVDIKNGRVVRLVQGRLDQESVYFEDPAEPARRWAEAGAEWVHVVDLDGAFTGNPCNWAAIEAICATGMKVQMGGGMRDLGNVERAFLAGVSRVVIGTKAVDDKAFIAELVRKYAEKIAIGIDAKGGKVAVRGWVDTAEAKALDLAKAVADLGVQTIIYTDISRDGMLVGPNYEAQEEMCVSVPCRIIASGGVGAIADVERFRGIDERQSNFDGVIIGKALYEGRVDLPDALAVARR